MASQHSLDEELRSVKLALQAARKNELDRTMGPIFRTQKWTRGY